MLHRWMNKLNRHPRIYLGLIISEAFDCNLFSFQGLMWVVNMYFHKTTNPYARKNITSHFCQYVQLVLKCIVLVFLWQMFALFKCWRGRNIKKKENKSWYRISIKTLKKRNTGNFMTLLRKRPLFPIIYQIPLTIC